MIEKFYPSKRPAPVFTPSSTYHGKWSDTHKAEKRGLSIEEYRKRCVAVAIANGTNRWMIGDVGFPFSMEDAAEHGQCRVVGIVRHFDEYGTVAWNDPPFILTIRPVSPEKIGFTVSCTSGYLVKESPLIVKESC